MLRLHNTKAAQVFVFEQSFTDHSHTGSIRCVAISEKGILASGSTDETINLLNLAKRKEMGSLMHHSGTVTCLKFHEGSHMFSCSDDKTVCVWKCNKWECLRTFRGHKKAVNCVSVHPSGKLALSVGTDRSLHTWNLVTGRSAYITNIKEEGEIVIWSSDGNYYAIIVNTKIDIYKVETASIHCKIQSTRRINTATFIDNTVLAYGGEGGELLLHDVVKDEQLTSIDTETSRIKSLISICSFIDHVTPWLISASSDGYIKVFRVNKRESGWNIIKLAEHDTKFRLLCVAAVDISKYLGIKTEKLKEGSKLTGLKEEISETDDILPPIEIKEESDSDSEESSSEEPIPVKKKKKNPSAELESKKKSQRKNKLKNNKKKKKSSLS